LSITQDSVTPFTEPAGRFSGHQTRLNTVTLSTVQCGSNRFPTKPSHFSTCTFCKFVF
jgi:hypothetical protein